MKCNEYHFKICMEKKTHLLLSVLSCVFITGMYILQTDWDKIFYFRIIENKRNEVNINWIHQLSNTAIQESRNNTSIIKKILNHLKSNVSQYSSVLIKTASTQIVKTTASSKLSSSSPISWKHINHSLNNNRRNSYFLCPHFSGGLGNQLFQFASVFGIAKSKNMRVIIGSQSELNRAFKLESQSELDGKPKNTVDLRLDISICQTFQDRNERQACAYDPKLVNFNSIKNLTLGRYLQSWKYFDSFRKDLRKLLTFQDHIQAEVNQVINNIVTKFNYTARRDVTIIGVHVRRGDMVDHSAGYDVATPAYMNTSVHYFLSKYNNSIFIISSQDILWTKHYIPNTALVEYINHTKRELIVAILASCDHTITTVGSFGWWIGWLAGGEVTYYKWPAKEGSALRNQYSKDYSDFFYPGWIGL